MLGGHLLLNTKVSTAERDACSMRLYYAILLGALALGTALGLNMGGLPQLRPHLTRRSSRWQGVTMAVQKNALRQQPLSAGQGSPPVSTPQDQVQPATRNRKLLAGALLTSLVFQNAGQSLVASSVRKVTVYDGKPPVSIRWRRGYVACWHRRHQSPIQRVHHPPVYVSLPTYYSRRERGAGLRVG